MASILVVEDGSVVPGANSFATVAQARLFAATRGQTLPVDDDALEILLVRAADYLGALEPRFQGQRLDPAAQSLCFPRCGVLLFGQELAHDVIPVCLVQAQCSLAVQANTVDLLPAQVGRVVRREKLDVIETEYADDVVSPVPSFPQVDALLAPLFTGEGTMSLEVLRV